MGGDRPKVKIPKGNMKSATVVPTPTNLLVDTAKKATANTASDPPPPAGDKATETKSEYDVEPPELGSVSAMIVGAEGLRNLERAGVSDPYCVVWWEGADVAARTPKVDHPPLFCT